MKHLRRRCEDNCRCDEKRYFYVFVAAIAIGAVELFGGWLTGSLFVVSDAFHAIIDGAIDLIGIHVSRSVRKKSSDEKKIRKIWGIAAAVLLIAIAAEILRDGIGRLLFPQIVSGWGIAAFSLFAVAGNWARLRILRGVAENITARAARLHILSDLWHSAAAVAAGAVIAVVGEKVFFLDSVFSIIVALMMFWWARSIIKESLRH